MADIANEVVDVLKGVLIHQRVRWGALLGHQHQFEGWWKAEMALALESLVWRADLDPYCVIPEAKPERGSSSKAVDLAVVPWDHTAKKPLIESTPRVWIELKERGTWWQGGHVKALSGFAEDLEKWRSSSWTNGDTLLVALVCVNDCARSQKTAFPKEWTAEITKHSNSLKHEFVEVGYPLGCDKNGEDLVRWARLDLVTVYPRTA